MGKWVVILLCLVIVAGGVYYALQSSSKPLPGEAKEDLGQDHVPQEKWSTYQYNSNPPTSGPHDVVWTKAGIYSKPTGDGFLIHSLEHGYVIISYNCDKLKKTSWLPSIPQVYADHPDDDGLPAPHVTPSSVSSSSSELFNEVWNSTPCLKLQSDLKKIAEEKKIWKLIIIPRPNMDSLIALTAWTRIQKLDSADKEKIHFFIDMFRDRGPEKTMEQ